MNVYLCGDLHGRKDTIRNFYHNYIENTPRAEEENWIILLGDAGLLYYFDYRDRNFKRELSHYPFKYFVIRGNHEARASVRQVAEPDLWEEVECFGNKCLRQPAYPNIYYARDDGGIYDIDGRKALVIPGAYSVDKWYRLQMGYSWFPDEQLAPHEQLALELEVEGQYFDLVLSHTCAYRYMPTDLFLNNIDQSSVDNSMEHWMEQLMKKLDWGLWLWAHYHADRIEAPHCEILYREVENLCDIEQRWKRYDKMGELDWWLPVSPSFKKILDKKK